MACAQTGSGKTAAFLFPMFAKMLKDGPPESISRREAFPIGLILEPTRELAVQTQREALKFAYKTGIRCVVVYGGTPIPEQEREIRQGIDILIATPGRLIDFIERKQIDLTIVRYLILDEGDRMLDMGFEPQIRKILEAMHGNDHETIMCSATFPEEFKKIASTFMEDYVYLAVGRVGSTSENITQTVYRVEHHDKIMFLIDILKDLDGLILIFVERKIDVDMVANELYKRGFKCASIHGDKSQYQRERALDDFRHERVQYLVATDVASRGIDIPNIGNVINYDTPKHIDQYVHRIGRTGRIGKNGNAISFLNEVSRPIFKDLIELLRESKQIIPGWFEDLAMGRNSDNYSELPSRINNSGQNARGNSRDYNQRRSEMNETDNRYQGGSSSGYGYRGGNKEEYGSRDGYGSRRGYESRGQYDYQKGYEETNSYRGRGYSQRGGYNPRGSYQDRDGNNQNSDYGQRENYDTSYQEQRSYNNTRSQNSQNYGGSRNYEETSYRGNYERNVRRAARGSRGRGQGYHQNAGIDSQSQEGTDSNWGNENYGDQKGKESDSWQASNEKVEVRQEWQSPGNQGNKDSGPTTSPKFAPVTGEDPWG